MAHSPTGKGKVIESEGASSSHSKAIGIGGTANRVEPASGALHADTASPEFSFNTVKNEASSQVREQEADDPLGKYTVLLQDPLSEVTRKERRTLLGLSILSFAVVKAHLVPTEVTTLGLKIPSVDEGALVLILFLIVAYFTATFTAYALPDYLAWRINFWKGRKLAVIEKLKGSDFDESTPRKLVLAIEKYDKQMSSWASWAGKTSAVRSAFEFLLPIVVGIFALIALWNYQPTKSLEHLPVEETGHMNLPPL